MTRRDLLRHFGTMTAAAIALPIDLDKLIWVPKPIITVPFALDRTMLVNHGAVLLMATEGIWRVVDPFVNLPYIVLSHPPSSATSRG